MLSDRPQEASIISKNKIHSNKSKSCNIVLRTNNIVYGVKLNQNIPNFTQLNKI